MKTIRILNLGAGVQSTALCLMSDDGTHGVPLFDHVIFADTGDETPDVYAHLEWLIGKVKRFPIHVLKPKKSLSEALTSDGRSAAIPAFLEGGGMGRRQCTSEYKIQPINRFIRREILGNKPGQRVKGVDLIQYFGLSFDEMRRIYRVTENFKSSPFSCAFPLFDLQWERRHCVNYLRQYGIPHEVPRSACYYCPYKSDREWQRLKADQPSLFADAVKLENDMLSSPGNRIKKRQYLHRDCIPLDQVDFDKDRAQGQLPLGDCEGMCGL